MSKHTPGPWRWLGDALVQNEGHRPVVLCSLRSNKRAGLPGGLAERGPAGTLLPLDTRGPNACLIAAAPDLLSALTAFVSERPEVDSNGWHEVSVTAEDWNAARAAIERATGGAA